MDQLSTFQANDSHKLFRLAKALQEKSFFKDVLNSFQYKILMHVLDLDNLEVWNNLMDGNCSLSIEADSESPQDPDHDQEHLEEGTRPIVLLALNLRFLLWEEAVDFYYSKASKSCQNSRLHNLEDNSDEYHLIELLNELPDSSAEQEASVSAGKAPNSDATAVREEEDDYDDDEDDNEPETAPAETTTSAQSLDYTPEGQVIIKMQKSDFAAEPMPEENLETENYQAQEDEVDMAPSSVTLVERDSQIKNFNKIYHNFEYDRETLSKRRKLERSDMQLENQKPEEGSESQSIPISFGAASHSLKHLLGAIRDKRDEISLSDLELRTLFMDLRKNRGKWANDDRVGQEELYEACEKVLLDLRGYTEHSTPFLNKVSKREAPNYGLIIKKPMDLNTVMKKLKALSYNSKNEFVDDLMLIWNNCLLYNADPKHFLRAHAIAMQKRTQKLAPTIPDVVIRNRSELEKDEENENDGTSTPGAQAGGKKTSKKGQMRRREEEKVKEEATDGVSAAQLPTPSHVLKADMMKLDSPSAAATPVPEVATPSAQPASVVEAQPPANTATEEQADDEEEEAEENENDDRGDEDNDDVQDAELQAWKVLTAKSRANYCSARASLFDENYNLKLDADAIIRESKKMSDFDHFLDNKEVVSKGNKLLDNDEPYLLEYDIAGGIPELAYSGVDEAAQENYENHMVETILKDVNPNEPVQEQLGLILPSDSGLNALYTKNITEIQEIRKICFKISLIRQMQTQQFMHRTQMRQPEIEYIKEIDVDPVSKLPNHDIDNSEVQYAALRRNVAKIAMHTGFETTESFAINTLTQVAEKYMLNLAKLMKLHCESTSRNLLSPGEIVLLSLLENGVEKPDDLYTFVQERLKKNEVKLTDLRAKLSGFLKELLRPSLETLNEQNFGDNSEQFTTGDFTNELGDDFFGFKELGLDKEFKLLTSSVPVYLLHSRLHNSMSNAGAVSKSTKYEDLREMKTERLTKAAASNQIGILQHFYQDLVHRTEAAWIKQQKRKGESAEFPPPEQFYLLEDEELPQKQRNIRPRLPPTGKIQAVKKKPLVSAFILPEEPEPTETMDMDMSANMDVIMEA